MNTHSQVTKGCQFNQVDVKKGIEIQFLHKISLDHQIKISKWKGLIRLETLRLKRFQQKSAQTTTGQLNIGIKEFYAKKFHIN